MGYFDALTASSFKQVDGQWTFYPYGTMGRGYVLPTEERYLEIRSWVKRSLQVWLPLLVLTGLLVGWAYSFALLPVFGLWYWIRIRALAQTLKTAPTRLTFNESYRAQARGHNLWTLWLSEIGSLVFVAIGLVILSVDPSAWLISIASIVFFGGCAVVIGLMIRSRMK